MRTGLIAQKLGMTRIFDDDGKHVPVTVLKLDDVPGRRGEDRGERRLHRGAARRRQGQGEERLQARSRPLRQGEVEPKKKLVEFRVSTDALLDRRRRADRRPFRGRPVRRRHRHLDRQGLRRRHEALEFRRPARHARRVGLAPSHGSTGQRQDPGKVFKNKKMAGHLGAERVTTQNLKVVADRCRARPDHGQGRGAGRRRRLGADPRRGQAAGAEGRARSRVRSARLPPRRPPSRPPRPTPPARRAKR